MPDGDPVGELRHDRLGDDHGAGLLQSRVVSVASCGGTRPANASAPTGGRHVGGVDVVLQRDGDAVQAARARGRARRSRSSASASASARGFNVITAFSLSFEARDAVERLPDDLARDVTRPCAIASRMSGMVASTIENGRRVSLRAASRPPAAAARSPSGCSSRRHRVTRTPRLSPHRVARDTVTSDGSAHGAHHWRIRRHRRGVRGGIRAKGFDLVLTARRADRLNAVAAACASGTGVAWT